MLRGYELGYCAGDNLAALSAEIRVPVTSPLNIGAARVEAFLDAGTVMWREARSASNDLIAVSAPACSSRRPSCRRKLTRLATDGRQEAPRALRARRDVLAVNATHVVHSGVSGNNGGYHTNPPFLEGLPNESSS